VCADQLAFPVLNPVPVFQSSTESHIYDADLARLAFVCVCVCVCVCLCVSVCVCVCVNVNV
jgi:hypothetical protein